MLKNLNQPSSTTLDLQIQPAKNNQTSSPDRESERHSEVDNEDIILVDAMAEDIDYEQEEEEEDEDAELAQMRLIEQEKSKAIQSVFKDLISQVNKMNEVLIPCSPAANNGGGVGQSPMKVLSPVKSSSKMGGDKENSTKKLRSSTGAKLNNGSPVGGAKRMSQTLGINNPQEGALLAIFNMVMEIKNQTSYLVERQADLEYLITQDLKPTIEDGLTKIRQDIRRLNGSSKAYREGAPKPIKRKSALTTNFCREKEPRKESKNQQLVKSVKNLVMHPVETNQVIDAPQTMVPQRPNLGTELQANMIVTSENECTFIRKLDQTELRENPSGSLEESKMEMSVGAHLIKIIQEQTAPAQQANNLKPKPKRVGLRNFNFKCNLDEIDKIIEEDIQEINLKQSPCLISIESPEKPSQPSSQAPLEIITEINKSIKEEQLKNPDEHPAQEELKRPSTGRKKPRQVMGINNINFHKGGPALNEEKMQIDCLEIEETHLLREKSKTPTKREGPSPLKVQQVQEVLQVVENAAGVVRRIGTAMPNAFGGGQGIRIKRMPTSKVEDDPILALLQLEEQEETKESPVTQQPTSSPNNMQAITPRKMRAMQIKRQVVGAAMFKAPADNLIETLLQEDEEIEVKDVSPTAAGKPSENVRVNNFIDKSPHREGAGTERSPIHIRKVSPMLRRNNAAAKPILNLGAIGLDQSDDEITNSEKKKLFGENPFNEGAADANKNDNHQDNMKNLFFHQRSAQKDENGASGMTGDFGK